MHKILTSFLLLVPALIGCQANFTPAIPNFNPTSTFTPTSTWTPGTPTVTFTSTTGSPTATQTPTPTGSATPTLTPSPTLTGSPTSTGTPTPTGSPTATVTPTGTQVCPPTAIGLSAGVSIPNYGQSFFYVIRAQSDWDAYTGIIGATPPVNFANQMLLVENWGTEYCQPGNGMVYRAVISSACVNANSIDVRIDHTGTCTCGGSCYYTMASTQVSAVVLPASNLPVSIVP